MPPINNITILGGGLTGLTTAYRLSRLLRSLPPITHDADNARTDRPHRETRVTILEKSRRIGGWVESNNKVVRVPTREEGKTGERQVEITLEAGPRSIRPKGSIGAAYMLKLIQDLDLQASILSVPHSHPSAKNRYILSRATNKLVRLPSGLGDIVGIPASADGQYTQSSDQPGTDRIEERRLRKLLRRGILRDLFRASSAASTAPTTSSGARDTTVHGLVASTLGPEIANALISAMVHGIYAADSRKLSVRSTFPVLWEAMYPTDGGQESSRRKRSGSLVWNLVTSAIFGKGKKTGTRAAEQEEEAWRVLGPLDAERKQWSVYGLRGGLSALTRRLEEEVERAGNVDVVKGCTVDDIRVDSTGEVKLSLTSESGDETLHETSLLISTLNPATLHPLLTPAQPLPHLTFNPSTNVGVVNIVYPLPSDLIHPAGFGYLVPRTPEDDGLPPSDGHSSLANKSNAIGVIFDSTTLPVDPTPEASKLVTKLTVMLGGPHWKTDADIPQDVDTLKALAQEHLQQVFPVLRTVEPVLVRGWIHRNCIPTYLPGHGSRLRELDEILSASDAKGANPWAGKLVLAGSGYGGVGVNDCVGSAEGVVRALASRWSEEDEAVVTGLERWRQWT